MNSRTGSAPPGAAPPAGARDILVRETLSPPIREIYHVFETIAFLSTLAFIVVFVVLFQIDRASRKAESGDEPRV